ncbi:hypothetical protein H1R20_g4513, partial [Candolleomyces eurysporus]
MAELTHSGGGDNRGLADNPERNTPVSSNAATPGTDGGQPSSGAGGIGVWMGRSMTKGRVQAIAMGTIKTALGIAVTLVPEPFKGPAEALLKVMDVIDKVDSNEEEVEILKKRCELLGSSIVNVVKEKDTKLLSKDLRDSIGRLAAGMWTTLEAANKEKSTGLLAYVLAEDDVEVLKKANKSLDQLLHCFWIENHIAGTIVLADILITVQDQAGHFEVYSLFLHQDMR